MCAQPLVVSTLAQVTVAAPQPSAAPTAGLQAGMLTGLQPTSSMTGWQLLMTGGVVSTFQVMTCAQVVELEQASTAV